MGKRKFLIVTAILAALTLKTDVYAANNLTQMDLKKSSSADSVDVTFHLSGESANTVVSRKANNRYVVLLPNVSSESGVTPALGAVKDLITNVEVKNVNDGIGGYTKITFSTTKPINIKTYTKKSAPLTQAQKDTKNIIAQHNTKPAVSTQNTKPAVSTQNTKPQPAKAAEKPAVNNTPARQTTTAQAKQDTKKQDNVKPTAQKAVSTPKLVPVDIPKTTLKPVKQEAPKTVQQPKAEQVQPVKTQEPKLKQEIAKDEYVPKMKFDKDGKRIVDLEPRVSHDTNVVKADETPVSNNPTVDNNVAEDKQIQTEPDNSAAKRHDFPMWILFAGGSALAIAAAYLIFDAIANKNQKDESRLESFYKLSEKNQARRRRREYYDIVNNDELNWQEKYKLYTEKEKQKEQITENQDDMSYVANMTGKGNVVLPIRDEQSEEVNKIEKLSEEALRKNLQAKISQMEHALSQTPSMKEPEEKDFRVKSVDNAIIKNVSDIKLKSFSKPVSLGETLRANVNVLSDKKSKPHTEGKFVKLRESALSMVKRRSAATDAKIGLQGKYINGEMNMDTRNNYENSSVEEYLSLLDRSESGTSYAKKGMTNSISRSNIAPAQVTNGMVIQSGYNIDSERGIYLVNMGGVSAIVGKIRDNIVMLKKFDTLIDKQLQVRLNSENVYIVRAGNYKCLVDVTADKIGTLIEI